MNEPIYGNILVVDDDEDVLQAARLSLKGKARQGRTEKDPEQIPALLKHTDYDIILLDMNFAQDVSSGEEGFRWLDRILEIDPSSVVSLNTAFGDVDMAVRAIKEGEMGFVQKLWHNEKLLATLSSAVKLRRSREEVSRVRDRPAPASRRPRGSMTFIDEIGNVPLDLQPKLLRSIQRREITRLGESKACPVDIRHISATNLPIYEMAGDTFRKDLLYRINTVEIRLPPLRERVKDIPLLVEHFIDRYRPTCEHQYLHSRSAA